MSRPVCSLIRHFSEFLGASASLCALFLTQVSCELNAPLLPEQGGEQAGAPAGPEARLTLLLSAPPLVAEEREGRWAAEVREVESGRLVRRERLEGAASRAVTLSPLPPARYSVTVFLETVSTSEDLPRYAPCPSPPSPRDPLSLEGVDTLVGQWSGALEASSGASEGEERALTISRLSCGGGALSTTLTGEVQNPEGRPLWLWLEALDEEAEARSAVFSLTQLSAEDLAWGGEATAAGGASGEEPSPGLRRFTLTQVPTGRYRATVFEDSDGDGLLTPCLPAPPSSLDPPSALARELEGRAAPLGGSPELPPDLPPDLSALLLSPPTPLTAGADQLLSEPREVLVERGLSASLGEPLALSTPQPCGDLRPLAEDPEGARVALRGRVQVSEELLEALYTSGGAIWAGVGEPAALRLRGGVRLMSTEELALSGGRFTLLAPLSLSARPEPLWLWVDQGGDGRLLPCDAAVDPGTDLRWWRGESSELLTDSQEGEPPALTLTARCGAPQAVVSGGVSVSLSVEGWAPRPLILSREDLFSGEVTRSVLAWLSAEELEGSEVRFERRVPPGSYAYSAHIDQDLRGAPTPCGAPLLGDLFTTSDELIVNAVEGRSRAGLSLRLAASPCPNLSATARVELDEGARVTSREGVCGAGEVLARVESAGAVLLDRCLPWDAEGAVQIQGLYAGLYRLTLCLSARPALSPGGGDPSGAEGCPRPSYIGGAAWLDITEGPTLVVKPSLSRVCSCP